VTSIRSQNPQLGEINLQPFVEEFARSVGMNPKQVWSVVPRLPGMPGQAGGPVIPGVMDKMAGQMKQAEGVRSMAGELGAMANQGATQELAAAG
jgi:hypothetical protein